ncbi:MAG: amine oxidase, partial [Chloroflexota bacterium]
MSRLQPVHIPHIRSLWLQEALSQEPDAERVEPLAGAHRTDVCIVGGGYTGLWTALRIKELDPSVEVMLLEADMCG